MASNFDKANAVQRMQHHIEEHLGEPITLHTLARSARYSPYYAARMFKDITGKTPFEYIRHRRMTAAALKIQRSDARIIDVALDFVFHSHEGFTRAFARHFGLPPVEFRRQRPVVPLFLPAQMRDHYVNRQKEREPMTERTHVFFVQVIERPARTLILKRAESATDYFEYCDEVGCDVWASLGSITEALHEPMGLWLPDRYRPEGTSKYVQGVEVATGAAVNVPDGFDTIDLPPCKLLVFQGQPFEDDEFEGAITSLWDVIDKYNPEQAYIINLDLSKTLKIKKTTLFFMPFHELLRQTAVL